MSIEVVIKVSYLRRAYFRRYQPNSLVCFSCLPKWPAWPLVKCWFSERIPKANCSDWPFLKLEELPCLWNKFEWNWFKCAGERASFICPLLEGILGWICGTWARRNNCRFYGNNAFDDPNMGCFCAPPWVVYLHTKFQGGWKNFIFNFAWFSHSPALNEIGQLVTVSNFILL